MILYSMVKNLNFTVGHGESLKCFKQRNDMVRFAFQKSLAVWGMDHGEEGRQREGLLSCSSHPGEKEWDSELVQ